VIKRSDPLPGTEKFAAVQHVNVPLFTCSTRLSKSTSFETETCCKKCTNTFTFPDVW